MIKINDQSKKEFFVVNGVKRSSKSIIMATAKRRKNEHKILTGEFMKMKAYL